MLIVITVWERDSSGSKRLVVSHGIEEATGEAVVLPQVSPEQLGAVFDTQYGEYVLH